jgi:hypothetical protein
MWNKTVFSGVILLLTIASAASAAGAAKCDGTDIANGPFSYTSPGVTQATFSGTGGSPVNISFNVAAPSPNKDTSAPDVFPGQGAQNECAETAYADLGILEIERVADASGNPLDQNEAVDLESSLGQKIAAAFSVQPGTWNGFFPGASTTVDVTVSNPDVSPADYGGYAIKLAARADGYGIGVGPGVLFSLVLAAPTLIDTTPPVVSVTKPTGNEILGVIGVEVVGYDPDDSAVATGLASLTASVSSIGGTVSGLAVDLTLDNLLTADPGVTVTGTGSFTPTGGSGLAGTTSTLAFNAGSLSGIGTYTVTTEATDGAGNPATISNTFKVNYAIAFQKESGASSNVCTSNSTSNGRANCAGQFQFTVNRSNATSDGAFMFDHTVEVDLVRSDDVVVATHSYGTGSINTCIQIDATNWRYQTSFKRGDLYSTVPNTPDTYKAMVYFLDVDGNRVLQGTSNPVSF